MPAHIPKRHLKPKKRALSLLPFPARPSCGVEWCVVDDPDHRVHFTQSEGPLTRDDNDEVVSAAVSRMVRMADATIVEVLIWGQGEGGRSSLLTPDEADELAEALTHWAAKARGRR